MSRVFDGIKMHFLGVGGVSMSKLALFSIKKGAKVSGYDCTKSENTLAVERAGGFIYYDYLPSFTDFDVVVYSSAIKEDNPELKKARAMGVPCFERYVFLGAVSRLHKETIAVAGTHGKTTTTALIEHVFCLAGIKTTAHIGGESLGEVCDGGDIFLTEACEYKKSFLSLKPDISLILNAEHDHPDCYPTAQSFSDAFKLFAASTKNKIYALKQCENLLPNGVERCLIDAEEKAGDCSVIDVVDGGVTLNYKGEIVSIKTALKGRHNAINIAFVYAVCRDKGIDKKTVCDAVSTFKGVKRRYEILCEKDGAKIILDYAHHPTEIKSVLSATKGKTLIIFQPHTFSRTAKYFDEFVDALNKKDVILYKTFSAREKESDGLSARALAAKLGTICLESLDDLYNVILKNDKRYDNVLVLGAGDIDLIRKYFQ